MSLFRFEDLVIWQRAIKIGHTLVDIADRLERQHKYKFAEQLPNAALSISNNISEGSGSISKREIAHFVNIAKRSTFENANMVIFFRPARSYRRGRKGYFSERACDRSTHAGIVS